MKKLFVLLSLALSCISASADDLKTVVEQAIAYAKEQVAAGEKDYEIAPVVLDNGKTYTLTEELALGTQKVRIHGAGAIVTISEGGQITTETLLNISGVNFDCENATKAPIALSATPSSEPALINETANQKVLNNSDFISLTLCNFRELKQSLIYANKQPWALSLLEINSCIIQLNHTNGDPVINWYGSNPGAIKKIVLTNNTIYNIVENTSSYFIRYGNASNAQPQKVWGKKADGTNENSYFIMKNNTLCQTMSGKDFANNFPNTSAVILDWKGNAFYNTFRLQKIGQNNTRNFQPSENITWSSLGNLDGTDKSKFASEVDPGFVVPTTALDFANVAALKANFANKAENSLISSYGDSRWAPIKVKNGVIKNAEGKAYEYVLAPDLIVNKTKDDAVKPGINSAEYPWVEYVNPTSTLDDGTAEVQQSNRWTDINPETEEVGTFIQVKGNNGSVNSPVISKQWGKVMNIYVSNMAKVVVYATGSGGSASDLNAIVLTATPTDGSEPIVAQTEPGTIAGKGTKSAACPIELDPAKTYAIEINSLIEKDMMVTGFNLYGVDSTPAPVFHAPVVAEGAKWETILGPDMIVTKTKDGANKPGIDNVTYNWIEYVNPTSTLDDGTAEVQQSNRWTDINPETGVKGEFIQATGKNGSVQSPVVSSTWGKYIVFNVKGTATMNIYGAGSASGSAADNNCLVVTATSTDGEKVEATSTPGGIYGKGTASDVCTIQLNPAKKYIVKVIDAVKDIQITGINLAPVAIDGDALGNTTGINDINAAETVVKAKKYVMNGRIVIESANGTYSVTGAQLK